MKQLVAGVNLILDHRERSNIGGTMVVLGDTDDALTDETLVALTDEGGAPLTEGAMGTVSLWLNTAASDQPLALTPVRYEDRAAGVIRDAGTPVTVFGSYLVWDAPGMDIVATVSSVAGSLTADMVLAVLLPDRNPYDFVYPSYPSAP